MTNSRSTVSRNRCLAISIAFALVAVMAFGRSAFAGPRKRVVVLEFRGPNANKFHADVVKILRVRHTVVSVEKWESAAEDEGATKVNSKNVKKIARKLNVDGVIVGEVERRRERFILRLKVREGRTGDYMQANPIEVTSSDDRLDNKATRDLKDELLDTVDTLDVAVTKGGGGDDDEDDDKRKRRDDDDEDEDEDEDDDRGKSKGKDKGKGKSKGDDEEEEEDTRGGSKSRFGKDDEEDEESDDRGRDRVKAKGTNGNSKGTNGKSKSKGSDDEEDVFVDEEELGGTRGKSSGDKGRMAKGGGDDDDEDRDRGGDDEGEDRDRDDGDDEDDRDRTASADDEDDGAGDADVSDRADDEEDVDDGADLSSPAMRAVDAVIGLSVSARRLGFTYSSNLMDDSRPLGYRGAPVAGVYFDADIFPLALSRKNRSMTRHIGVNVLADRVISMKTRVADMAGATTELETAQRRYGAGVVLRYPLGASALLGARVRYSRLTFEIDKAAAPSGVTVDVPNVKYGMVEPALGFTYLATPKIAIGVEAAFLLTLTTGEIGDSTQYGGATVTGIDGELHGDYMITSKIFARAAFKLMTLGYKFKGTGDLIDRNGDGEADVFGARDSFFGMTATLGYVF
jgi:hypothetical protein